MKIKILFTYSIFLLLVLLWPFTFNIERNKNLVRWNKNTNGIAFYGRGQIISTNARYLFDRLSKSSGLTLEILIKSGNNHHGGHARIVSYSQNKSLRNYTIAQSHDKLIVRLRTTETDLNAMKPHLEVPDVFKEKKLRHIIVTYNFKEICVYIDGELCLCDNTLTGSFMNWDSAYPLIIGNEVTGDKQWNGEMFYAAIYDRTLLEEEIFSNFKSLTNPNSLPGLNPPDDKAGIVVLYLFNEGEGSKVTDNAGNLGAVDLYIPNTLPKKEHLLGLSRLEILMGLTNTKDITFNVILFMPLGYLIYGILISRSLRHHKIFLYTILIGLFISIGFEFLQYFIEARASSIVDVFSNTIGVLVGIATYLIIQKYAHQKKQTVRTQTI